MKWLHYRVSFWSLLLLVVVAVAVAVAVVVGHKLEENVALIIPGISLRTLTVGHLGFSARNLSFSIMKVTLVCKNIDMKSLLMVPF